ncbi:MAG: AAA family ATPase [Chloroflexi bacterium]|nr:MAG: AAA family ATPase [Chloroflexota bacterium]
MSYKKTFDPPPPHFVTDDSVEEAPLQMGDRQGQNVYVYTEKIILAVNVALATTRPLLVRGPSGSGKSSLASSVADILRWRYYEEVIGSRTQARDLLWRFDTLRRLNDAQAQKLQKDPAAYIEPGVLWWAFDRDSALRRGSVKSAPIDIPFATEPAQRHEHMRAVVLIDEIDKADPDVPNDLLVPLGAGNFVVSETETCVRARSSPLVFITTNEERVLPRAFLRRCVVLTLEAPDELRLYEDVAKQVIEQEQNKHQTKSLTPSAAEYLDTIRACLELGVRPHDETWEAIFETTLLKPRDLTGGV